MDRNDANLEPTGILGRLYLAYNDHDANAAAALYAADAAHEDIAVGHVVRGRDAIARGLTGFFAAFPDAHWHPSVKLEAGGSAVARYVLTATLQQDFGPYRAAGQRLELRGVHVLQTVNGSIQRSEDFWDSTTFGQQMKANNKGVEK
jgi:steroid delta-isomerase-like uncharacterized protein